MFFLDHNGVMKEIIFTQMLLEICLSLIIVFCIFFAHYIYYLCGIYFMIIISYVICYFFYILCLHSIIAIVGFFDILRANCCVSLE